MLFSLQDLYIRTINSHYISKMRTKVILPKVRDSSSKMMYHGPWGTPGCVGNGRGHIKSPKYPRALLGQESSILMESRSFKKYSSGTAIAQVPWGLEMTYRTGYGTGSTVFDTTRIAHASCTNSPPTSLVTLVLVTRV